MISLYNYKKSFDGNPNSKIERILNWRPGISIEESVNKMLGKIKKYKVDDFTNAVYYNIQFMKSSH